MTGVFPVSQWTATAICGEIRNVKGLGSGAGMGLSSCRSLSLPVLVLPVVLALSPLLSGGVLASTVDTAETPVFEALTAAGVELAGVRG